MPRNHKPTKVSQAITRGNGAKYQHLGEGHLCPKSPSGSHWWRLGTPDGAVSDGVCRYCDAHREFATALDRVFSEGAK